MISSSAPDLIGLGLEHFIFHFLGVDCTEGREAWMSCLNMDVHEHLDLDMIDGLLFKKD